jgi:hypothetical protein
MRLPQSLSKVSSLLFWRSLILAALLCGLPVVLQAQENSNPVHGNNPGIRVMHVANDGFWVHLEWNKGDSPLYGIGDNSPAHIAGYNVYRSRVRGGPYQKITSKLDRRTFFKDYGVKQGRTYYYVTTAVNSHGRESRYSNEANVRIPYTY